MLMQVLAIVSGLAAFASIVALAWRGGYHSARVGAVETRVAGELAGVNRRLDTIESFMRDRQGDARQIARLESDVALVRARSHEAVNAAQAAKGALEVVKQLLETTFAPLIRRLAP